MKVVALAGGVGGAKLAEGLAKILPASDLTIIVNTGDDFRHMGLYICPDLDTICYTLAGIANPDTGWGLNNETWNVFEGLKKLQAPCWFRMGDRDLATHLLRTLMLDEGTSLSEITYNLCVLWGIEVRVLPMSDLPVSTIICTQEGELAFQEYFVHRKCTPEVKEIRFNGIEHALPAPGVVDSIHDAAFVVLCPSNPWVSIDPILAVPGVLDELKEKIVLGVSPIIAGKAVKGPAAKMFNELGFKPTAYAVAMHYSQFLTGLMIDTLDADLESALLKNGIGVCVTNTLMKSLEDRIRLAEDVIDFGSRLNPSIRSKFK